MSMFVLGSLTGEAILDILVSTVKIPLGCPFPYRKTDLA